jgi:hypothetical protein
VKFGHVKKNQEWSDMMEVDGSGEIYVMQDEDWIWLGASTAGVDFDAYVSVDQEHATCGVLCMEVMCGVVGSGSCMEEGQGGGGDADNETGVQTGAEFYGSTSCISVNEGVTYMHMTSPKETKRTLLILKGYYSV